MSSALRSDSAFWKPTNFFAACRIRSRSSSFHRARRTTETVLS